MDAEPIRIKSYRIKGGAIVTVARGERSRRYQVSLLRLARLSSLLVGWPGAHGCYSRGNAFDVGLKEPTGYRQALHNAYRYGGRRTRALFPGLRDPRRSTRPTDPPPADFSPAGQLPGATVPGLSKTA